MSKNIHYQRLMRAMASEERKDELEVQKIKKGYIDQIKKVKKEDLFPKNKKTSLWQKIKILIWGT